MTHIKQLINQHSRLARESSSGEAGSHKARFNAFIAVRLNEMADRGNMGISDAVYTQVLNNAHDFVNGVRGRNYG